MTTQEIIKKTEKINEIIKEYKFCQKEFDSLNDKMYNTWSPYNYLNFGQLNLNEHEFEALKGCLNKIMANKLLDYQKQLIDLTL